MKKLTLMIDYNLKTAHIARYYNRNGYMQTQLASMDYHTGKLSPFRWASQDDYYTIFEEASYISDFETIEEALFRAGEIHGGIIV